MKNYVFYNRYLGLKPSLTNVISDEYVSVGALEAICDPNSIETDRVDFENLYFVIFLATLKYWVKKKIVLIKKERK